MKIVRCRIDAQEVYGILSDDVIEVLKGTPFAGIELTGETANRADARLLAPVEPSNVIALGLNYRRHAQESGMEVWRRPGD